MIDQSEEYRQMWIESEILRHLYEMKSLLKECDHPDAERQLELTRVSIEAWEGGVNANG